MTPSLLEQLFTLHEARHTVPGRTCPTTANDFYHTFALKKIEDRYHLVYNKDDADHIFTGDWCHNADAGRIMDIMKEVKGGSLLDAGCCDGYFGFMFESLGAHVTFLDLKNREIRSLIASILECPDDFIHKNVYQCGKLPQKYDYIWCQDLICHLFHPMLAIQNFRQICKKKVFIGVDRFELEAPPKIKHFYPIDSKVWTTTDQIPTQGCFYCGGSYPYAFTTEFILAQLNYLGFKNARKKTSYEVTGHNGMRDCGIRIIDILEAEVDDDYKIPPHVCDLGYVIPDTTIDGRIP